MELPMREALRRLCLEFGWSYAVFWRATGLGRLMYLIWEDGYCDPKPSMSLPGSKDDDGMFFLVYKILASQVHVIGDGLIGQVASMGKHQWITLDRFSSLPEGLAELNSQLAASIQTVVVVPVLPFGVIQIGSTQLVRENVMYVDQIKNFFMKLNCGSRALSSDTKNVLTGKSHLYSSPVILSSDSRSTDICTSLDGVLAINANGCNPAFISAPAPRLITKFLSASSSQLNEKKLPVCSEMISSKQSVNLTNPSDKKNVQSTQRILPRLDRYCVQKKLPAVTISGCQNEPPLNSSPTSDSLKVPEEVFILRPDISASEITSNKPNSLDHTKSFLKCGSSNISSGNVHDSPYRVNQCSKSCATLYVGGMPSVSHGSNHSIKNPGIHEISRSDQQFSFNKVCHGATNAGISGENNNLVETPCTVSSEPEVLASHSDFFSDILQEYELSYSKPVCGNNRCSVFEVNSTCPAENNSSVEYREKPMRVLQNYASPSAKEFASSSNLFAMLGFDHKTYFSNGTLDDVLNHKNITNCKLGGDIPKLLTDTDAHPVFSSTSDQISCSELFSGDDADQLLGAIISKINAGAKQDSDDGVSCKTSLTNNHNAGSPNNSQVLLSKQRKNKFTGFVPVPVKAEPAYSNCGKSSCSFEKVEELKQKSAFNRSQISTWVENINYRSVSDSNSKKVAEGGKLNRKRSRPGESPRPRPKDRQMIQDRIKELRELVPNGAKCSIDTLLEKTIKHMLFLQSVTEHADKLKVAGEPKISNEEFGLLLKNKFEGGATWAFEVGAEPMSSPTIVVEDLNLPRQMRLEMLCEERGFFLEIADFITGLGLTVLKGVMEARKNKFWARFAVEANRDVTRMEIFLSLVRFLESTAGGLAAPSAAGDINMANIMLHQTTVPARVV